VKKKQTKTQRINAMLAARPELTIKEVAEKLGVTPNLVHQVRWKAKRNSEFVNKVFTKAGLKKPSRIIEEVTEMKKVLNELDKIKDKPDPVNHPAHYKAGGVETIDFIEAKDLNYRLGNVVKYVSRAGKKGDPIEDLKKARWYLDREISVRENA
jgi:predicted transcriptional regulator